MYECPRCNYQSKQKCHMRNHYTRKNTCINNITTSIEKQDFIIIKLNVILKIK